MLLAFLIFSRFLSATGGSQASGDRIPDPDAVLEAVRSHVASVLPWSDIEASVKLVGSPRAPDLPEGPLHYRVPRKTPLTTFNHQLICVDAIGEDETVRSFWVVVDVTVRANVVCASRQLRYGQVLAAEDLVEVTAELGDPKADYIRNADEALGLVTRRSIEAGDPLTRSAVTDPVLVRNGDTVRLVFRSSGVQLTALARAEQTGKLGQVIRVRNLDSSRPVNGQVIGEKEVQVH